MHLEVAEGWVCSSLSFCTPRNWHSMFALFNRRPPHLTSHPQKASLWEGVGQLCHSPLPPGPPCRKDLHKHLLEWWRCCAVWGFTPALVIAFSLPSPRRTLVSHKQETQDTVPATHRGLALSSSPRQEQRRHTYT